MQKKLRFLLCCLALLAVPWATQAQNARDYRLETGVSTTAWVTLSSSATDVSEIEGEDDAYSSLINIGFPFTFAGTSYTQFSCNSNGRVRLGSVCSNYWLNPFTTLTNSDYNDLPFLTAFGMDNTLEASGSYVKYELTGTAPNRILVIEYNTPSEYDSEGDLVNYQIQFMEDSSRVRFVYGQTAASYYNSYQIGIAASATDILMINPTTHSSFFTGTSTTFSVWPGQGRYYQLTPTPPALCPAVMNITLNDLTSGSARLSWLLMAGSAGTPVGYEIEYGPTDGSAAPTVLTSTLQSVTLTGLNTNEEYKVRIRTNCGTDGYSAWDSVTFTTMRMPCLTPDLTSTPDTVLFSNGTSTASGMLVYSSYGNTMYQTIFTASELLAAGLSSGAIMGVDFGFSNNSSYAKEFTIFMGTTTRNSFTSSTDYINPGTMQQVYGPTAHPLNTSGWQHYTFSQPFMWDGSSNIAICTFMNQPTGTSQSSSSFSGYYTAAHTGASLYRYKDGTQFTLTNYTTSTSGSTSSNRASIHFYMAECSQLATCTAPALSLDSVGSDEVTLSWIPGYDETAWDVEYRVSGTPTWTSAAVGLSSTTYTLTGLTPATNYDVRVLTICGTDTFAAIMNVLTNCVPIAHESLPFYSGFEDLTATGSGSPLAVCWSRGYLSSGSFNGASYPYSSTTSPHTGVRNLYFYGYSTTTRSWLCLPEFEDSVNTLQVLFWARKSSDSYSGQIKLGVMTDPTDHTTFQTVYTLTATSTEWQKFEKSMGNAPASGYITIMVDGGSTSSNYIYIDDISVFEIPNCPHVDDLRLDSVSIDLASISWTETGSAESWSVEYGTTDFVPGSGTAPFNETAYDSTLTLYNLNTGTTYYVYVRADCMGDTSTWEGFTFNTLSGLPATVPYICSFEDSGNNGWEMTNGTQANQWYVGEAANNGGSRSMYISNDGGLTNSFNTSSTSYVFAERTFNLTDTGEYAYSFDWRTYGESSYDFIRTALVPASVMFTAGSYCGFNNSSAVPTGGIALDGGARLNLQSTWQTRTGTFHITTPGSYKWVFMWRNDPSGGTQPPAAIDNVQLVRNTCPQPTNLTAVYVGSTEVSLSWSAGSNASMWIVSNGYNEDYTTSANYTFTGLQPNTQYNFTVRAICSADDTSMAAALTVLTECGGLSTFPFVEDFESQATGSSTTANSNFIRCWNHLNNATQYFGWPYISSSASYNHTPDGTKGLYWYASTTTGTYGDYYYVVLPAIDTDVVTLNSVRVSFWAKATSTSYHPVFNVGVMTDPTDHTTFTTVNTVQVNPGSSTAWNKFTTEFDTYEGYGAYIAIRALRPSSTWYAAVDDITIDLIPDCPEVTNITASNITTESANISWTEQGEALSWDVEWGLRGFETGTGTYENVTSLPFTLTDLEPNTEYELRITPECYGIAASASFIFRTECLPMTTLPLTMGFETTDGVLVAGASNTSVFVECWHRLNNATEYYGYPYVGASTTYAHSGSRGLYWYNTTTTGTYGDYQTVVLPAVDTDLYAINTLRIRLWAKSSSTSYYPSFQVGVMTDPYDNNTFQPVSSINVDNSTAWRRYTANLSAYTGTGNYVAIRALRASWTAYVDDITLELMPDCPEVTNMVAQFVTATSASINWTEIGDATNWTVEYGTHGFTPGTGTSATASAHPFSITGLTADTEYDVYVTPVCSGTTGYEMITFRTECNPTSAIPLTMGFETSDGVPSTGSSTSATFIDCWHRLNNGTSYFGYPYVGSSTTYAHSGSRGLYWYNTTTTGTYGDYQIVVLPAIDVTIHPLNTLQLSFWVRSSSSSYSPVFQVGVMTDPNDPATFTQVGTVQVSNSTEWEEFTTGLAAYSGSGTHVAIRALRANWTAYVDDITLDLAPVCPGITDLAIDQVGTTGALVSWNYQAGFSGTPSACAVDVFTTGGTPVTSFTATSRSMLVSGLQPSTNYRVRVRPDCGAGEYGSPDSIAFRTGNLPCVAYDTTLNDTILYSDGQSSTTGVFVNTSWGNTFCQAIYTAQDLAEAGVHPGWIKGLRVGYSAAGSYDKELSISLGTTTLSSFSSTSSMVDSSQLTLVYGPQIRTATSANSGWVYYTFNTPFFWNGTSNIILSTFMNQPSGASHSSSGFYAYSTNTTRTGASAYRYKDSDPFTNADCLSTGSGSTSTYLPSVSFITDGCSESGTCARPMVVVDSAGTDYIAVNWTAGYQETVWDVDYREEGATAWTTEATVTTPGYLFTDLDANQTYEIRITSLCGDTSVATVISVTTPCDVTPLPFTTSFEGFPSSTVTAAMPSCWTRFTNYSSTTTAYPYASTSYAHSGSSSMYMYSTSSSYSYFTMPRFSVSIDSLSAHFWLYKSNTSYDHTLSIGVMTDPNDFSTYTEVATVTPRQLSQWEEFEVYFDSYTGDGQYITFLSPNGNYSYPYLDDLTIDVIPDCRRVQGITVSNITLHSADVSWRPGNAIDFDLVCLPAGTSPDAGTPVTIYGDSTYTLTGLQHSTAYDLYVRAYCYPDTSQWSMLVRFRTECGLIDSLPFFENFEGVDPGSSTSRDFVPCWNHFNNGSSYYGYPYVSSSTSYSHNGGNRGLYWYNTSSGGSYGTYAYVVLPPVDTTVHPVNTLQLSFWAKSSSTSYYPELEVGVMRNNSDTTFTRMRTIEVGNSTNWELFTIPFGRYQGPGNQVAIRALGETGNWYVYVDEIMLDTMPHCPAPLEVVVDSTATDAVAISWIPTGSENQWAVNCGDFDTVVSDTSLTLTGLMPNTPYTINVRAICGPADTSSTTSIDTRTECVIISTLPWSDDFESYNGTSSSSQDFGIPCWSRITDATSYYYPYLGNSTTYNHTNGGTKGLYWYVTSSTSYGTYQIVALPLMDTTQLSLNTLLLSFWAKSSSTSYTPTFEIGAMTDDNPNTFTPIDTLVINGNTEWELFEYPFNNYTGHGNRLALRSAYSMTGAYWYSYVDDFTIEPISPCPRPDSLMAYGATSNSVTLSWHETDYATSWVIEYGPAGFTPGTGTMVTTSSNPYLLTGLPSSYEGEFYVRSLCGGGDTAFYNREPCPFSTAQVAAPIPYHCNFESTADWDGWQTNSNSHINWARGTAMVDSGSYSMYISPDGGTTYGNENFSSLVNASAYRDIDFGTIDSSFTITFRAKVGGTVSNSYDGLMVFLVDPAVAVVAPTANITSPWGNVNDLYRIAAVRLDTVWHTYAASFDTISGVHRVAFFWFNQNTGASYPFIGGPAAVDNIHIDYSSCPRPVNLDTVSLTSTSATLEWDGPVAGQYRVAWRQQGASPSTNTYINTTTNRVTITGLDTLGNYVVWVQKICGPDSSLFSDGFAFQTEMCDNGASRLGYDPAWPATTTTYAPMGYSFYNYSYIQTLIDSAQLAGLTDPISAMAFNPVNGTQGNYYTHMDVYLANVPETDLSTGFITPDTSHIFIQVAHDADLTYTDGGWRLFGLDTTFQWDGHSNLLVTVNRRHGSYSSGASFNMHTTSSVRTRYLYQDGSAYNINNPTGGTSGTLPGVGDLKFIACPEGPTCREPIVTSVNFDYQSATITWQGDGTDYQINIKESAATNWPATDIAVTGNTHTFTGLQPSTYYTFRIRQDCTADTIGYSNWYEGSFLTDSLPCLPPTGLHTTAVTNATATFDWTPGSTETNWDIHVWFTGGLDSVYRVSSRPATVGGFIPGLTYNASIRSLCGTGLIEGDWGDTITFATATCPDVTNFTTSNVTANSITLNWTADPMAQGWIIEYGFLGFNQGTGTTVNVTTNSYVATGLLDETDYQFYIRAVCGTDWTSENWASATATTQSGGVPCGVPTGVSATAADNSITVNWTSGTGNLSFEIEYGPSGFNHGSGIVTSAATAPATLNNLEYETPYDIYVRAICDQNTYSGWSIVATATTGQRPSEDCQPVTNLTVTDITDHTAHVAWTPAPETDSWQVVVTDPQGNDVVDQRCAEPFYDLTGLTEGTNYTVKVRTDCGDGNVSAFVSTNFRTTGGVGISDVTTASCTIFPNPTSNATTISVSGVNGRVKIEVVDMNGRVAASETLECSTDCTKTMDVDRLAQGAYFVRITADNVNMVRKLIVR